MKWPLIWARPFVPHYLKIWTASILSILLGVFLVWASYATTLTGFDVTQTRLDGIALIGMPLFVLGFAVYVGSRLREKKAFKDSNNYEWSSQQVSSYVRHAIIVTRDFWKRLE